MAAIDILTYQHSKTANERISHEGKTQHCQEKYSFIIAYKV